ncbi:hypothetical protein W02_03500 [Nitrospira sp. KM1]|uniref:S1 family peptidase n=1 Tax=Nitrospira sp. KM1 TaxID=1936990 RepID=UPI0013A71AEC|nr:trypsin-like serine protease [Nitrospira sp. KM1]BCA53210.1 hypothetical protein W02_03500 [Nitrospira sp. KM1]
MKPSDHVLHHVRHAAPLVLIVTLLVRVPTGLADETVQPSGDPGDVQERAVIRDHRTVTEPFTPAQKPALPKVMTPIPIPPQTIPNTGAGGTSSVVGGTLEPDYRYPWVVRMNGCGGVLVDPQWVLTAAHCVTPNIGFGKITFSRVDPYSGSVHTQTRGPMNESRPNPGVYMHPNYAPSMDQANDIALIKLERPFDISPYIQTVGLPRDFRHAGMKAILASIDHTAQLPPGQLSTFHAPIPPGDYPPKIYITAMAANASLCKGDSGSGIVTVENGRATVRGIASQGTITSCMTPSGEAVFTDVFAFRGWILQTMGKSDTFSTRVRWSGRAARGTMGLGCVNPYNMTLWGPLNVVGVEEGIACEAGQTQTIMCNLDKNQGNVGVMVPTLSGLTMRTTINGSSQVQTIPATSNTVSYFGSLPAGATREFTCQITTPITGTTTGTNAQVLSRGVEGEAVSEPVLIQPSPFDPSEAIKE